MPGPRYTAIVQKLPASVPFVGPETLECELGGPFASRIGANESVFGPSPRAIEAMARAATDVWKYGDPENHDLKEALAAHHGVAHDNIVVGEGVDCLLGLLNRLLVEEGTPVVTSLGAYPTFNFHVAGFGGVFHTAPYADDHEDPVAIARLAQETKAPLVYFANPDNPMGTHHDAGAIRRLMDDVPRDAVLCLDEAYVEFAPEGTAPEIDVSQPNVIRFRTFSKAYGMAGARVGYGIAHKDLALSFNKIRNHFGVNRIGQAGALAALADQDYLQAVVTKVSRARERIAEIAAANGLRCVPSATNFVAVDCGADEKRAKALVASLQPHGIFIRMPFVAPQNRCVRITVGTDKDLARLKEALPAALGEANKAAA